MKEKTRLKEGLVALKAWGTVAETEAEVARGRFLSKPESQPRDR